MSDSCFVSHLECSATGERHEAGRLHNLSRAGKPLLVRYDLAATRAALPRERLSERAPTLWRYRELLPYRDPRSVIELGETMTPVIDLPSREFESPLRLAISSSCARCARAMDGRWRSPMRRSMRPGRRPVATTDCCCVRRARRRWRRSASHASSAGRARCVGGAVQLRQRLQVSVAG